MNEYERSLNHWDIPDPDAGDVAITILETLRLGTQASLRLDRPITDDEIEELYLQILKWREGAGMLRMWERGEIQLVPRSGGGVDIAFVYPDFDGDE